MKKAPLYVGAAAVYPYSKALEASLERVSRFDETYSLARRSPCGAYLHVPRAMCPDSPDDRRVAGIATNFTSLFRPRSDDQARVMAEAEALLWAGESFVLCAPTGYGKCLAKTTRVVMFDGTTKAVEDIVNGDVLMGPDSTPRTVFGTHKGYGPIYRVTPTKGEPWECNDVHVLSLKRTKYFQRNGAGKGGKWVGGEIVNVPVDKYLSKSRNFKHLHKLWRAGFELPEVPVFDPYLIGLYLADGTKAASNLHLGYSKYEALKHVSASAYTGGVRDLNNQWQVKLHGFARVRESLLTCDNKRHIPAAYLRNSRSNRLQLLAGILDGDGSLAKDTVFDLTMKDEHFCRQVLFLCRSLGFAAYASKQVKGIKAVGFSGEYWRITISGHTDEIPTKIPAKQAAPRRQKKDPLVSGFSVEYVRDDDYYGFALDGDHLFLLEDCTVTHNTVLGCALAAGVGRRTLVITTKEDIVDQWITSAKEILGLSEAEVGVWRADTEPAPEAKFVVGLIHSILKGPERYPNVDFESFGFVIVDESHRLGAEQFSQCMWWLPAKLRLGLSATPKRKDGKDDVIEGHIGPVRVTALLETLIPNVIMRRTQWKVPLVARYGQVVKLPHEAGRIGAVTANMATNIARNQLILEFLLAALGKSRSTIVFSDTLKHLLILRDMLLGAGVAREHIGFYVGANGPVQVYGDVPAKLRKAARNRDAAKPILLATYAMASEATNLPWLDTAVLATPRSDVVQVVGRIRREYPDKKPPVVLDLVDEDSALLANYAKSRLRWYKQVGAKIKLY